MENKEVRSLICPVCKRPFFDIDLLDGQDVVTCAGCERKFYIADILQLSTEERVEEIRSRAYISVEKEKTKTYREIEESRLQNELERIKNKVVREENEKREKQINDFKKSKFKIVIILLILFSALLTAVAFNDGKIYAGIIATVMDVLFVGCLLMGLGVIPEKIRGLQIITFIFACFLFLPCNYMYTKFDDYKAEYTYEMDGIVNYYHFENYCVMEKTYV